MGVNELFKCLDVRKDFKFSKPPGSPTLWLCSRQACLLSKVRLQPPVLVGGKTTVKMMPFKRD